MNPKALETAARLEAILESAVDGILSINDHGIIESANQAAVEIFGYDREELIGSNVNMLMPSPYHETHNGYIANYVQGGEPKIIGIGREVSGLRKDGNKFPLYLAVSEGTVANQKIFTGIVRDLSELRLAQERRGTGRLLRRL